MLRERVGCVVEGCFVETCDVRALRLLARECRAGGEQGGVWWRRRVMDLRSVWTVLCAWFSCY